MIPSRADIETDLLLVENQIALLRACERQELMQLLGRAQELGERIAELKALSRRPLPPRTESSRDWCLRQLRADKLLLDLVVRFPDAASVEKQRLAVDSVHRIERLLEEGATEEEFAALEAAVRREREAAR